MLFLVFGSSAAGKTYLLAELRARSPERLAIHDFDEIEVPSDAETGWRQQANERWVGRALGYQEQGIDLVLAGQTPFGELLASPSASRLEAISACLLDCSDDVRLARLGARGTQWLAQVPGDLEDFLKWAAWMRRHARDPQFMPHVIRNDASPAGMRWDRWRDWKHGDPRWRVTVFDTSALPVEQLASAVLEWIERERALVRAGTHPLAHWAE